MKNLYLLSVGDNRLLKSYIFNNTTDGPEGLFLYYVTVKGVELVIQSIYFEIS